MAVILALESFLFLIIMLGAIAGDIIGSVYEGNNIKTKDFPLFSPHCHFTDDTVLTVAIADALLHDRDYAELLKQYYLGSTIYSLRD